MADSKTGPRPVPLSPAAARVLAELPRVSGNPWVIPGHKPGTHIRNLDKPFDIFGHAVRFGTVPIDGLASLVVGEGIETVLSLVNAVPEIGAAAALSAGSLGAFAPPPGVARLVIARDNDEDGALAAERRARFAPLFRSGACTPSSQAGAGGPRSGGGEERRNGQAVQEREGEGSWTPSSI